MRAASIAASRADRPSARSRLANSTSSVLFDCAMQGSAADLSAADWCRAFGLDVGIRASDAWRALAERGWLGDGALGAREPLAMILEHGTLAERIGKRLGAAPDKSAVVETWQTLAACLRDNRVLPG